MIKKVWQSSFLAMALVPTLINLNISNAYAEATIYEDNLTTTGGLRWGAPKLPYNQAADIKDSLIEAILGKVVPDRHGLGGGIIVSPFSYPEPGKLVFVSLWGSKIEGCFVEMIIQYAPNNGQADLQAMIPKLLEMGVGDQPIRLPPQQNAQPKSFSQPYRYTVTRKNVEYTFNSTWYMSRNLFVIDSNIANILINAPAKQVKMRITLANDETLIIPIGEGTVKKWKEVYSFNPACTNLNRPASKTNNSESQDNNPSVVPSPPVSNPSQPTPRNSPKKRTHIK